MVGYLWRLSAGREHERTFWGPENVDLGGGYTAVNRWEAHLTVSQSHIRKREKSFTILKQCLALQVQLQDKWLGCWFLDPGPP